MYHSFILKDWVKKGLAILQVWEIKIGKELVLEVLVVGDE
jgi:hypothetical protein